MLCCYFSSEQHHLIALSLPLLSLSFSCFLPLVQTQIEGQTSTGRIMEKPTQDQDQEQQQQQPPPLRCPRCDSSNTKFCYYNNYSLSQPRHFCKACKRYWTRGGTLRNVPVGGGCRKNRRVKRPAATASAIDASTSGPSTPSMNHSACQSQINLSSASSNHMNPFFYGLPTNHSELSHPFSTVTGYDLQPRMNGLGLGFSGGLMATGVHDDDYRNGFNPKQIQDLSATSNPLFPDLGSSSSTCTSTSTPILASLLASGLQKNGFKDIRGCNNFHGFLPYEDQLQMPVNSSAIVVSKEFKMVESGQNKVDWNNNIPMQINQVQLMGSSPDPSLFWNTTNNASNVWLDPASIGSSVPSLI